MDIRQIIRLLALSFFTFVPNFQGYWIQTVILEVMTNNFGMKDEERQSQVAACYFAFCWAGLIVGSFVWPYLLRLISKRFAILIALFLEGLFTAFTGQTKNLNVLYLLRFLTGLSANIHSVGKDFIFEFAKPAYRSYAFSITGSVTMAGAFIGPYLGYELYVYSNKSFAETCAIFASLFFLACFIFFLVFFLDFKQEDHHDKAEVAAVSADLEETAALARNEDNKQPYCEYRERQKQKGIIEVLRSVLSQDHLRNITVAYFLATGLFGVRTVIIILFMETPWAVGGLGIASQTVSYIFLASFIPGIIFIMASPTFMTDGHRFYLIFKEVLSVTIFITMLLPLLRDVIPLADYSKYIWIAYLCFGLSNLLNTKIFSPFVSFYLNNNIDKYSRTALNSITFLLSTGLGAVVMLCITPMFSISLFNPVFVKFAPYNKYLCFTVISVLLVFILIYFKSPIRKA